MGRSYLFSAEQDLQQSSIGLLRHGAPAAWYTMGAITHGCVCLLFRGFSTNSAYYRTPRQSQRTFSLGALLPYWPYCIFSVVLAHLHQGTPGSCRVCTGCSVISYFPSTLLSPYDTNVYKNVDPEAVKELVGNHARRNNAQMIPRLFQNKPQTDLLNLISS